VLLVPHAPLAEASVFRLTVQGVQDRAGNAVIPQTTQFTTGAEPDTVAPVVVYVDPFNGATEVPVNVVITAEMNEPIDLGSVDSNSCPVYDAIGELVSGSYAVSADGRTVSFVPEAPLTVGSRYSADFSCNSQRLLDLAGNPLTECFSTSFTTGAAADTTGPQVVAVSPAESLAEVPINARVMIAFDEPIQVHTVDQVTLHDGAGEVEVIRLPLSNGNRLLTLLPVVPLAPRTAHTVTIAGVEDLVGNPLVTVVTTFTTKTGGDCSAVRLLSLKESAFSGFLGKE
jgi:hypothetical protein